MTRAVSSSEAKNNLGTLLSLVRNENEAIIVENRGQPAAVIISIEEFERLQDLKEQARREAALAELRSIRSRLDEAQKDLTDAEREALIEEISSDVMNGVLKKTALRFER